MKDNGRMKDGKTSKKKTKTAQYKWVKHMYAELDEIKDEINKINKEIYDLKLRWGSNARRIKRIEEKLGLKQMKGQRG